MVYNKTKYSLKSKCRIIELNFKLHQIKYVISNIRKLNIEYINNWGKNEENYFIKSQTFGICITLKNKCCKPLYMV